MVNINFLKAPGSKPRWVTFVNAASGVLAAVASIVVFILMFHMVIDVSGRILFNRPLGGTLEIVQYWWMPTLVFLSLAYGQVRDEHIRVSLLVDRLAPRARKMLDTFTLTVSFIIVLALVYYGWLGAMQSAEVQESALGAVTVPIWPIKFIAVIGLLIFALQILVSIYRRNLQNNSQIYESSLSGS